MAFTPPPLSVRTHTPLSTELTQSPVSTTSPQARFAPPPSSQQPTVTAHPHASRQNVLRNALPFPGQRMQSQSTSDLQGLAAKQDEKARLQGEMNKFSTGHSFGHGQYNNGQGKMGHFDLSYSNKHMLDYVAGSLENGQRPSLQGLVGSGGEIYHPDGFSHTTQLPANWHSHTSGLDVLETNLRTATNLYAKLNDVKVPGSASAADFRNTAPKTQAEIDHAVKQLEERKAAQTARWEAMSPSRMSINRPAFGRKDSTVSETAADTSSPMASRWERTKSKLKLMRNNYMEAVGKPNNSDNYLQSVEDHQLESPPKRKFSLGKKLDRVVDNYLDAVGKPTKRMQKEELMGLR